jgi:glucosamine--fructose-6-phosphate aminotransferase (isomerizing)
VCGIFGFTGDYRPLQELIEGLKKLEYRGYDSAGIAYVENNRLVIAKKTGRVAQLEKTYQDRMSLRVNAAIAHTRWATHGIPNDLNAHPHCDCKGRLAVVHNGIIENYSVLRNRLLAKGHVFYSETDTEVIVHLIEDYYHQDLVEAFLAALKDLRGAYAIGLIDAAHPERLLAAREGSPLLIAKTKHEGVISSDVSALLGYTKYIYDMEDREMVVIEPDRCDFMDLNGKVRHHETRFIDWEASAAEKEGFKFYMEKEITEEPRVIRTCTIGRVNNEKEVLPELDDWCEKLLAVDKITLVAAGTSYHAGCIFRYCTNEFSSVDTSVEIASEFRYFSRIPREENRLFIAVSQSGETADTVECVKRIQKAGGKVLGLTNVVGSTISRLADKTCYLNVGPEIGVASTKAYIGQLMLLYLLLFKINHIKNLALPEGLMEQFFRLPDHISEIIQESTRIREIAFHYKNFLHFMYVGRGIHYPSAMEGALKLKEISYINANAYPGGELKHGPIALLDPQFPVFAIIPEDRHYEKMKNNLIETRTRNALSLCLTQKGNDDIRSVADDILWIPRTHPLLYPILIAPVIQLFAYHIADLRGLDVDKPRNLAKSVTVE